MRAFIRNGNRDHYGRHFLAHPRGKAAPGVEPKEPCSETVFTPGIRARGRPLQPCTVEPDHRARYNELFVQLHSAPPQRCLDGIQTSVRQLVRAEPFGSVPITADLLEITAVLVLKRNSIRDYLDLVKMSACLGLERAWKALNRFDALYPQPSAESALPQLEVQLASPVPHDLGSMEATVSWQEVNNASGSIAQMPFSQVIVPQHGGNASS